ncbi:DUF3021 domain-containing protein [Tenuibacillus multivorans]|uniref:DUF3021 domain-containing protein n=1 Tax=Tenuibacillus multivorans TaxID=237069 RepID=A0A1G9YK82_9BACI|nr:DUF3021 domain-containing protein [Tenuibacillus multivorans]GEL78448.1 hypothetical protein TMU01_26830 [Tenuibacillus multivorans]SDN09527.1 Protein of unknown function [Tenuibacillus multivorans]
MFFEAMRRSIVGLGFAAIVTFVALTIMMVIEFEATVPEVWKNMLGSMLIGVFFGVASLIFENESWSPLKHTVIHFILSIGIWLPLALFLGWVPIGVWPILIAIGMFIVFYSLFWLGARLYFIKQEKEMNEKISQHKA